MKKTAAERIIEATQALIDACNEINAGDPFAAGRIREIILANTLGHTVHSELHGHDAVLQFKRKNHKVEYKTSFEGYGFRGRYDVSWQPTWKAQEEYLLNEKIGSSKYHYFATFDSSYVVKEVVELTGQKVCDLLIPAFKTLFLQRDSRKNKKNSGLYATLGAPDIRKHGKLVYVDESNSLAQFFSERP